MPTSARRGRAPVALADVLTHVVRTHGWEPRLRREAAVAAWPRIAGLQLAQHTTALAVREGVLHIGVGAGVWAVQLSFFRTELLHRLRHSGYDEVRDIAFHVQLGAGVHHPASGTLQVADRPLDAGEPLPEHVSVAARLSADAGPFGPELARLYLAAQSRAKRLAR